MALGPATGGESMKPLCLLAAASPDPDDAHVDLVLDPDKLRVDAYLVQGKSASVSQTNENRTPGWRVASGSPYFLHHTHHIQVPRRLYQPEKEAHAPVGRPREQTPRPPAPPPTPVP